MTDQLLDICIGLMGGVSSLPPRARSRSGGTSGDGAAGGLRGGDGRLGQDLVAVVALGRYL